MRNHSHSNPARRTLVSAVGGLALVLAVPHAAFASVTTVPDTTAGTNGAVYAIAQVGDLTIIGGSFTSVGGKARLNAAAIRADGTVDPTFNPSPNGTVYAVAGSGDASRVFLGGVFTEAGGAAHANLAATDALTGAAVPGWQADTTGTNPDVKSLAVSGSRVYVGGRFGGIDGTTRKRLAALDVGTGDLVTAFRPRPDLSVFEVVVSPDGSTVYAGGSFTTLGGEPRPNGYASVDAANGDATGFDPSQGGGRVVTIGLDPDGSRLYVATANNSLFAYDSGGNQPTWVRKTSGDTQAIAASETELYIGGHFSQIVTYKIKRTFLASLNPGDGTVTAWDPNLSGPKMGVWAITITPGRLLVGGVFTMVGDLAQRRLARFAGTP